MKEGHDPQKGWDPQVENQCVRDYQIDISILSQSLGILRSQIPICSLFENVGIIGLKIKFYPGMLAPIKIISIKKLVFCFIYNFVAQ